MKKNLLLFLSFIFIAASSVYYFSNTNNITEPSIEELRVMHKNQLDNSPFKERANLSKKERKALGLPPNGYYEQMWELTLDPQTGRPMPERATQLQAAQKIKRKSIRGVGGDANNPWIERGPSNVDLQALGHKVGGRTRGIMFDPNDPSNQRVFAGAVSGGLWVNNNITDINSSWTLIPGIGANIAVKVIISDPNNSNTFYLGSGESYTNGGAIGNGIWKSTDAGATWAHIYGGYTGFSGTEDVFGIFYINDLVARDMGTTTELYASVAGANHSFSSSPSQWHSLVEQGLYKSTNNGANWTKFTINDGSGFPKNPNDIELDINNNIWFTTTRSEWGTSDGGDIYRSTDGISFTLIHNISGARRTELETSSTNANEFWVLANVPNSGDKADFFYTNNAFSTVTPLNEPMDADLSVSPGDFTRGQAFYDLEIEADANGILYAGGIDLFRSTDNGTTWVQLSKWSNNANLNTLNVSLVHADQHAIVFRPGNQNQIVFGNDGGIYYSDDIATAHTSTTGIQNRNKDYATIQFYYGAIDILDGANGDDIYGGAQDNGTSFIHNGAPGTNVFTDDFGGDGSFVELNRAHGYGIQTYTGNGHNYFDYPTGTTRFPIASGTGGNFINQAGLDRNLDILYSNSSTGSTFQIERNTSFTFGQFAIVRTQLSNPMLNAAAVAYKVSPFTTGSSKLFVGTKNGKLIRIDNADGAVAPTWTDISGAFVGSISDIEFGATESDIFVTMHNYGVTSVWSSTNGGSSWTDIEGNLPDVPVKCILQNPLINQQLIIGTALGVWMTDDHTAASPIWVQAYNGMSDVPVLDLDLRPSDYAILATTFGRGMFTSQFTIPPLSITENSLADNGIRIFPTVNDGNFNIVANRNIGNVSVSISNISGQLVHDSKFMLSNAQKGFSLNLNSGIHFVNIKGESINVTQKIIIK